MAYSGKKKKKIMTKFSISEISMVDRAAQQPATMRIMKRDEEIDLTDDIAKFLGDMILTTAVDEHAHGIIVKDFDFMNNMPLGASSGGSTSWQDEHSHPWILTPEGEVIIGMAKGHTHEPDEMSKRAFSVAIRKALAESGVALPDGSFPIENTSDLKTAIKSFDRTKSSDRDEVASHIESRAKALDKSDLIPEDGALADAISKVTKSAVTDGKQRVNNKEADMPDTKTAADIQKAADDKLAKVQAQLDTATAVNALGALEKAHYDGLDEDGQKDFLAKSNDERVQLAKAARDAKAEENPVVYKSDSGDEFRKNDDPRLVAMAKRADAERVENDKLRKAAAQTDLRKRAEDSLGHLPGTIESHMSLLKAAESIADETERDDAIAALKAQNTEMGKAYETSGATTTLTPEAGSPTAELATLAKAYAKEHNVTDAVAESEVLKTAQGAELYKRAYN